MVGSGHVLVSEDQRVVTALSVTSKCRVNAQIGNFTNLSSSDFASYHPLTVVLR